MRGTRLWFVLGLVALFATAIVAAGCGDDDDEGATTGDGDTASFETIEEGRLLVGTDTPFPPFEIGQPPDISGYDIEVVNGIAERLDLEVEYQDASFDTIFRDVAQGKFDAAVAASTITDERERTVDFSDPYFKADQSLLVAKGDTEIATVDDLGGKTVGAQDGTTGETFANDETDASDVRGFPEGPDAINALRQGQVDAVIIDYPVAEDAVNKQGDVEIAQQIVTSELYGIAFGPDEDALREAANEALTEMKDDGTIADLYAKYKDEFKVEAPPEEVLEGTHEPT